MLTHQTLDAVYATAHDVQHWQGLLDTLHDQFGLKIMLYGHDTHKDQHIGLLCGGIERSAVEQYEQHYAALNPWMHMNFVMPTGMVGVSDQALDQSELKKTEFYNDWLRHQERTIGGAALVCHRAPSSFMLMAAMARETAYDREIDRAKTLLKNLAPHIRRSIDTARHLDFHRLNSAAALDAMNDGVVLLRRSGRVAYANPSAEHVFRQSNLLRINHHNSLTSNNTAVKNVLFKTLKAILDRNHLHLPLPCKVTLENGDDVMVHPHVFAETKNIAFPETLWSDPICGALVIAQRPSDTTLRRTLQSFSATPAETALGLALMRGQSLDGFANERAVSLHTVRNQMRALLAKTGAKNQADFLRIVFSTSSPFH